MGRAYFTGDDCYKNFLVYAAKLNALIKDNKNWISTG